MTFLVDFVQTVVYFVFHYISNFTFIYEIILKKEFKKETSSGLVNTVTRYTIQSVGMKCILVNEGYQIYRLFTVTLQD